MKKYLVAVLIAMIGLVGCSTTSEVTIDVNQLAEDIKSKITFQDELSKLDADMLDVFYTELDISNIAESSVYVNTGATTEQIAVFKAVDKDSAKTVKEELEKCLEDQIAANENYLPDEIPKLKDPVLEVESEYVILVVSDSNDDVEDMLP